MITSNVFVLIKIPFFLLIILMFTRCGSDKPTALEEFEIHPDFELELVAAEPLIKDPVDLEFDENGVAYVLEMPGYPFEEQESRIVILRDTNNDGVFNSSNIYAEDLELASSIMPYRKGILVAAPPYLLFLKDTDGDAKADYRDTLMSGFSTGNLQHNYNGLYFGIDGWIYAANGGNSGKPHWFGDSTSVLDLREEDMRFKSEEKILERVGASSGGFGIAMDEFGRMYETHNLEHISQLVYPGRYATNEPLSPPDGLHNISDHEENGLARVYPIGEQESRVNHPEQSGYFSGSCGITYYGGGAFGTQFEQSIWVADVVLNLIHVDKLVPDGSAFSAHRILEKQDFLASSDRSFRPVNMTVGPDGSMYVVDMYRKVIEHPEWIPDDIEENLDIQSGKDKGRIYRIRSKNWNPIGYDFSKFTNTPGLITSLENPNQWIRNTAHRLLLERELSDQDITTLKDQIKGLNTYARLHSLWILALKNSLTSENLSDALNDNDPGIRENALLMGEPKLNSDTQLFGEYVDRMSDQNQRVRMQAALSMSTLSSENFTNYKDQIYKGALNSTELPMDVWNESALTLAVKNSPVFLFEALVSSDSDHAKAGLLQSLAGLAGRNQQDLGKVIKILSKSEMAADLKTKIITSLTEHISIKNPDKSITVDILKIEEDTDPGLIAAMARFRKVLSLPVSKAFSAIVESALHKVIDQSLTDEERIKQLSLIDLLPYSNKSAILFSLLNNKEPLKIQEGALRQLWEAGDPEIGKRLVAKWAELGPQSRRSASDILLYKPIYHDALLTGLENGSVNIGEMNFDLERRRTLLWWTKDENTKRRAEALFSDSGVVNRKDAIEKMKEALILTGSANQGLDVFIQLCAQCHIYNTTGTEVGPTLTEINRKSKETLLHDILDPNAAADTKYINHRIETNDGNLHIGIVDRETDTEVTIKKLGGLSATIAKNDIKSFTSLGTSMMLEGLEANMSLQDMADLLAFLQEGTGS